ncbi:membrane protein containing Diguanylate cyclase, predicted [Candidatus Magnetoovum chiemensis]|nr:membrane protein containing Diguanylate cyclase, predicted [Candidatus Magnetoovum chiemensis]
MLLNRPYKSIILYVIFTLLPLKALAQQNADSTVLSALKIEETINIDGVISEKSWNRAQTLKIEVYDGSSGKVTVTMKALYDKDNIYILAQWNDTSQDIYKNQWVLSNETNAWTHSKRLNKKGEAVNLDEDRFTIIWNINDSIKHFNTAGCAVLCHGDRMHTNSKNETADLWHWKSARTNPLNYADDQWLDNNIKEGYDEDSKEAAHHNDSKTETSGMTGSYTANSQTIKEGAKETDAPLYWKPKANSSDPFTITYEDIIKGDAVKIENPNLIDKTKPIPGYIISRPKGSRGDIDAKGQWKNSIWTVEIKRKLATGNLDDIEFNINKLYRFGIALMDNSGGFEAYGIGHSFDLGARTLEFSGLGSETVTTMALVKDSLETALGYSKASNYALSSNEINTAVAIFNTVQMTIAEIDPSRYLNIKTSFTIAKRQPSAENIKEIIGKIDSSILLLQGKIEPIEASLIQRLLVLWGKIQIYVFFLLGIAALHPLYKSASMTKKEEFRTMGTFIIMITIPIILESIGRLGIFFNIVTLQKLSFMTSEYATVLWAALMAIALFVGKLGFSEIDKAIKILKEQKEQLEKMAITDELTKIYNRRYLNRKLEDALIIAKRYNYPLSLIMLDIDYFKKVNDTYGHQCGDIILKGVAKAVNSSIRIMVDIPARYGGEEFAILLFKADEDGALIIAERLRKKIQESEFSCSGSTIKLTVSLGIGTYPRENINDIESLISLADQSLYKAKASGRNCIKTYKDI